MKYRRPELGCGIQRPSALVPALCSLASAICSHAARRLFMRYDDGIGAPLLLLLTFGPPTAGKRIEDTGLQDAMRLRYICMGGWGSHKVLML